MNVEKEIVTYLSRESMKSKLSKDVHSKNLNMPEKLTDDGLKVKATREKLVNGIDQNKGKKTPSPVKFVNVEYNINEKGIVNAQSSVSPTNKLKRKQ